MRRNQYYRPKVADPVAPVTFVHEIDVPTYLACQWTDEQTGGHCPAPASRFTGTRRKWFTFTNGTHADSLDPATLDRWYDFLELYVARRAPKLPDAVRNLAPVIYGSVLGIPGVALPDDPLQGAATFDAARAAFEALPPVRILFDSGAGRGAGLPYPAFEQSFARFPLPGTHPRTFYLAPGGALASSPPAAAGADAFTWSPKARPATDFHGDTAGGANGLWTATPPYAWTQPADGRAVSYVSEPLTQNTAIVGAGALQAWIRASAPSVDLQATVSEVRPDGLETCVTISAIGGDQPVWSFADTQPRRTATVTLARSSTMPSRLILPEVPGIGVPTGLPPCPGLRGEPCRTYAPLANRAG